jgi:alpha-tubulin suppressor-like RCC1 family protein
MAVSTWGFGKYGQLGNGQNATAETPQLLRPPHSATPLQLTCGAHFTIILFQALSKDGRHVKKLYSSGWGKYGRLGTGSEEDHSTPMPVALDSSIDVLQVSAGFWHAGCITSQGDLYVWGYNKSRGVLGLGGDKMSPFEAVPVKVPVAIDSKRVAFKHVACGYNYTYALGVDGTCWSWGSGAHGVLGHGDTKDRFQPTRVEVPGGDTVSTASCGYSHAAVVTDTGELMTVGYGEDGALGLGKEGGKQDKNTLQRVNALGGIVVVKSSCSLGERHSHTLACTGDGGVYSWGDGYKGKLGHDDQESRDVPARIDPGTFKGEFVVGVACGGIHSAAVTREGSVFTWGCGSDGRLGHPEAKGHRYLFRSDIPRKVKNLPQSMTSVDCSYYHTAALSGVSHE